MALLNAQADADQSEREETALVRRAQFGDMRAFETLLLRIYPRLRAYLSGLVAACSVDDVLQDVSLKLFQGLKLLKEPQAFRAWTYRITTRTAFRHLKRQKKWDAFERDPAVLDNIVGPDVLPQWEVDASFIGMLVAVSPASRAVLLLHYQQEMSLPHIAAILDIPLGTVKSRLSYGVATLRKLTKEKQYAL